LLVGGLLFCLWRGVEKMSDDNCLYDLG
jgi:hypothetical protein